METAAAQSLTTLPLVESFGDFIDVPAARIVQAQAEGRLPHVGKTQLGRAPGAQDLADLGLVEVCSTSVVKDGGRSRSALFSKSSGELILHITGGLGQDATWVTVAGKSEVDVSALIGKLREEFCEEVPETDPSLVPVRFSWYSSSVRFKKRLIESPKWDDVRSNYPTSTQAALSELHQYQPGTASSGRLLMFHGEPGTGKTTAVRSLARSWGAWCTTTYIVDPESLFTVPDYLLEVALEGEMGGRLSRSIFKVDLEDEELEVDSEQKWQLIVVEDVDELIRADAKNRTGQALGRLLNLTDGLLGQGLRTMFLLTTNERMESVHPAISRPGRCLANIEFSTFTKSGGEAWLRGRGSEARVPGDAISLAELFALSGTGVISAKAEKHGHGVYL